MDETFDGADSPTVMAGYGVGLPISRLYARYFGGDLNITSMEVRPSVQVHEAKNSILEFARGILKICNR